MNSVRSLFVLIAGLVVHQAMLCGASPVIHLSVESALARAPESNFQILLAQEAVLSREEAAKVSRSSLLPQVGLEVTQSRYMSPNVDSFTTSIPGVPDRFFDNRFDALIRGRLAVFDMGSIDNWNISKLDLQATRLEVDNVVQEILKGILYAYFTHWRNERRLDLIDANLERDRLLLQIARDQQEAGVATNLDVTRAEVQLAGNELARLQQETAVMDSSLQLKRILNYPLDGTLVLEEEMMGLQAEAEPFSTGRFESILGQRADYQQMMTELEREELAFKASKRQRLPSLELSGQWGYATDTIADDMHEQWSVQLGLSMPLFEGFRISSQSRIAASAQRQKELELENLREEIESEYRLALQNLQSSVKQVEVSRRTLSLNERELELARIRFEEGVADNSDVVAAQAALADAQDTLVEAEFYYIIALVDLARSEGDVRRLSLR